jgi:hypothetical protein
MHGGEGEERGARLVSWPERTPLRVLPPARAPMDLAGLLR